MDKIGVIGGGSFGTALASLAAENGQQVTIFVREDSVRNSINNSNSNPIFLPNIKLSKTLKAEPMDSLNNTDIDHFIWTIPSQYTRSIIKLYKKSLETKSILIATKGIEIGTGKLMLTVLNEELRAKYSVLSGPSFATELAHKKPTIVAIASYSSIIAKQWQEALSTEYFRSYTSDDMIGLEVGGAIKNVIAIAAGLSDGLKLGSNAKAGLITRGLAEITRFGMIYGAKHETFVGLSGLGDLVLTCSGENSRNNQVGQKLAQGLSIDEITASMEMIAEGVPTSKAVYLVAEERGIEMPICEEVYKIIYENKSAKDSIKDLMLRPLKEEKSY